jgi:hypothetical protein
MTPAANPTAAATGNPPVTMPFAAAAASPTGTGGASVLLPDTATMVLALTLPVAAGDALPAADSLVLALWADVGVSESVDCGCKC